MGHEMFEFRLEGIITSGTILDRIEDHHTPRVPE